MASFIVLPITAALAVLGKRRFEETVFPAIGIIILTFFLTGIFGSLKAGFFGLPIILIASVAGLVVKKKLIKEYVLTPGFIAFLFLYLFFYFFSKGRFFTIDADTLDYIRPMLRIWDTGSLKDDCLYYDLNWPLPLVSIWAYFCSFTAKSLSQGTCLFAYDIFIISALMPLFTGIKSFKEHSRQWLLMLLLCILLPILKFQGGYVTYHMVLPQLASMVYTYLMFHKIIYASVKDSSRWWYVAYASYGLILSCLLTSYGVYASIPLIMAIASYEFTVLKRWIYIVVTLGSACILATLFSLYGLSISSKGSIGILTLPKVFFGAILLASFLTLFMRIYQERNRKLALIIILIITAAIVGIIVATLRFGSHKPELMAGLMEYTGKLFEGGAGESPYVIGRRVIPIYDITFLIIVLFISGLASGRIIKDNPTLSTRIYAFNMSYIFGTIMYLVVLCIYYICFIRRPDADIQPSIAAYTAPLIVLSVVYALMLSFLAYKKDIVLIVAVICLVACVFADPVEAIFNKKEYTDEYPLITKCKEEGQVTFNGDDRVFYIDRDLLDELPVSFEYAVFPAGTGSINGMYYNPDPYKWSDIKRTITPEELASTIEKGNYTYVYIKNVDDFFYMTFYTDFANWGEDIRNDALYRVAYDGGGQLQIEYIAGLEIIEEESEEVEESNEDAWEEE